MPHKSSNQNYVVIKNFCACVTLFLTLLKWHGTICRMKNVGFCIPKNMANFDECYWYISSSLKLLFLESALFETEREMKRN